MNLFLSFFLLYLCLDLHNTDGKFVAQHVLTGVKFSTLPVVRIGAVWFLVPICEIVQVFSR